MARSPGAISQGQQESSPVRKKLEVSGAERLQDGDGIGAVNLPPVLPIAVSNDGHQGLRGGTEPEAVIVSDESVGGLVGCLIEWMAWHGVVSYG